MDRVANEQHAVTYMYMHSIYKINDYMYSTWTEWPMNSSYMHTCTVHVLMRDERRKEERSKQDQTNNKALFT